MRNQALKHSRKITCVNLPKLPSTTRSTHTIARKQSEPRTPIPIKPRTPVPRKPRNKYPLSSHKNPNNSITAQSYAIYDDNLTLIGGDNSTEIRQIASLTKMMTLLTAVKLCRRYKINRQLTYFRISVAAANVAGTSADLQPKFWISVEDLLYGLMLPSGNDAAAVLAENLGAYLYYESKGQINVLTLIKTLDVTNDCFNRKLYSCLFIKSMNKLAEDYEMINTVFSNPHGLNNQENYSTARDLAVITREMYRDEECREIVGTKEYIGRMGNTPHIDDFTEQREWMNSNRLLWKKGYLGAKTGHTPGAGNCLSTIYKLQHKVYYIIVMACCTKQDRFKDTQKLLQKHKDTLISS